MGKKVRCTFSRSRFNTLWGKSVKLNQREEARSHGKSPAFAEKEGGRNDKAGKSPFGSSPVLSQGQMLSLIKPSQQTLP